MAETIKRFGGWLERKWRALPWVVRLTLVLSKWLQGIQGVPALVATVLTLITAGALFLWTLPTTTLALWSGAAVLAIYGGAGAVGVALKAKSGRIDLMTDRAFWDYLDELLADTAGYMAWQRVMETPQLSESLDAQSMMYLDHLAPRTPAMLIGECTAALDEAVRREWAPRDDLDRIASDLGDVTQLDTALKYVVTQAPHATGLRGYRPESRLSTPDTEEPQNQESAQEDPET